MCLKFLDRILNDRRWFIRYYDHSLWTMIDNDLEAI